MASSTIPAVAGGLANGLTLQRTITSTGAVSIPAGINQGFMHGTNALCDQIHSTGPMFWDI